MIRIARRLAALCLVALVAGCIAYDPPPDIKAQQLVDRAAITVQTFKTAPNLEAFRNDLKKARAVVIFPQVLKAGFFLGGEGGNGVLIAQNDDGTWGQPAFYTMAAASLGVQIGAQDTEIVLVIRNDEALRAIIKDQAKLGADTGVTVGIYGVGLEASTTTAVGPDVVAFANSKLGAYLGTSLEGAALLRRRDFNEAYYATGAAPSEIIFENRYANPGADRLRSLLAQ